MAEVIGILGLFALTAAVVWHAHRSEVASRQQAAKSFNADISHVTILLNTMRDILQQQKDLARQFNENLERKSSAMRQLASVAGENLEKLRETKRQVLEELEEAREELASLRQQTEYLRERAERSIALAEREATAPMPELMPEEPLAPPRAKASKPRATTRRKSAAKVVETPPVKAASVEAPPELPVAAVLPPEAEPEAVSEESTALPIDYTESSREALRSLLGLDRPGLVPTREREVPVEIPAAPPVNGNGKTFSPSVRARVDEYHAAGMSIADIAHELGLGKGEVRLILSLGRDR